jgi:hypothetical protein
MAAENRDDAQRLKSKLNVVSGILRLGHEAFQKNNLGALATHIVNNSHMVLHFDRSVLLETRGGWPKIQAIAGQTEVNMNSEYNGHIINLARPFKTLDKPVIITEELLKEQEGALGAFEALAYLNEFAKAVVIAPIYVLSRDEKQDPFLWVMEFEDPEQARSAVSVLPLLCQHYSEAFFYVLFEKKSMIGSMLNPRKFFRPSRVLLILAVVFVFSLVVVRIPHNVSAGFEVIPGDEGYYYAPFDGVIEKCYFNSGDMVKKDDVVLSYNVDERNFDLMNAENILNKTKVQLDQAQMSAFSDPRQRGQVRLLELQRQRAEISIEKNKWYIEKSNIVAESAGMLDIGEREKMEGRAVRSGEKLFEVLSTENLLAQVELDEHNASVLDGDNTRYALYLHTRPEVPLVIGKVVSISPKPILTERKTFCYQIKLELTGNEKLICGMRGVARISGPKVSLGYYLFRNIVLWWRRV